MRPVSIVGIGQIPVQKQTQHSLRQMAAQVVHLAMKDAEVERVDALFAGNMLGDELQGQKHVAALIADEAGLSGIEALDVRAATGTGAAALRMAYLAVASGEANLAIAVGVGINQPGVDEASWGRDDLRPLGNGHLRTHGGYLAILDEDSPALDALSGNGIYPCSGDGQHSRLLVSVV